LSPEQTWQKMMLRTLAYLLTSSSAIAAWEPATDVTSSGVSANSLAGNRILSKARALGNNNNNNNYDYTWVANYSIKFQQCVATNNYYGGYFSGNNNNNNNNNKNNNRNNFNGMYEQRLVHFKLCPSDDCGSCEGGADYVVDMNEFVNAYVESKLSAQEYDCERVRENCYCQNANDDQMCEYTCYKNAGLDYCYEYQNNNNNNNNKNNNRNQFNLQEALECRRLEVDENAMNYYNYKNGNQYNQWNGRMEFFVGPYCANHGKKILLGVFLDETCSFPAPDGIYEKFHYGQKLPYSSSSLVENNCVSCAEPQDYNQQNNNDKNDADGILEVCQTLYQDSGKCESNLGSSVTYRNTLACDFIKTLPKISKWNMPKAIPAKVFASLFAVTTVMFAGMALYFQKEIRERSILESDHPF